MGHSIKFLILTLFFVVAANGQNKLNSENSLAKNILSPLEQDISEAKRQGFEVFKILPRGKYSYEGNEIAVRSGGAYYSFVKKSHSYDETPQMELQKDNLLVGFAGADYGFIADLCEISLTNITEGIAEVDFLINYKPPTNEPEVRIEQRKADNYEAKNVSYKNYIPAVVGHSYVLRSINFREADTLVALKVYRKDADGSLIIFWKTIKNFEKPLLARN